MQLHQQKCLPLKRKLPSWKHLVYIYNKVRQKELLTQTLKKKNSENTFTRRYGNHKRSSNINNYKNDTKLEVTWDNRGNMDSKKTVLRVEPSIKEMFPLFEWDW